MWCFGVATAVTRRGGAVADPSAAAAAAALVIEPAIFTSAEPRICHPLRRLTIKLLLLGLK